MSIDRIRAFDELIASVLPKSESDAYLRERAECAERNTKARELVRVELAHAFEHMGAALRYPDIARVDLERAITHLNRARDAAAVLDPEDA